MNSFDGRIKADAVVIGAGAAGAVSFYSTDTTNVVIDITGYFVPPSVSGGLDFFAMPSGPCNLVDTTQKIQSPDTGLQGPFLTAKTTRSFPVSTSPCLSGVPAVAYSLNVTAIPHTTLGYLEVWNSDFNHPVVSTLNAPTGTPTSNAALIITASGSISAYPSDDIDLIVDINGYFAPHSSGPGGKSLFVMTPCRSLDTRKVGMGAPVTGAYTVDMDTCFQSKPFAYVTNATVVPTTALAYLTLFDAGFPQPTTDTLHALDAAVTSNMAIVTDETSTGTVDAFLPSPTALIVDVFGFFDSAILKITTTSLPAAIQNIKYSDQVTAQGGFPPYTWAATGLPTGLTMDPNTGIISGITAAPTASYPVTVTVTDTVGPPVSMPLTLAVAPLTALGITPFTFPNGRVGVLYDQTVSATGGVPPYTWSLASGSTLPAGLSLITNSAGQAEISGTPTGPAGITSFSLTVTDSQTPPSTATTPFSITVTP
jgi:hypothetical protein